MGTGRQKIALITKATGESYQGPLFVCDSVDPSPHGHLNEGPTALRALQVAWQRKWTLRQQYHRAA